MPGRSSNCVCATHKSSCRSRCCRLPIAMPVRRFQLNLRLTPIPDFAPRAVKRLSVSGIHGIGAGNDLKSPGAKRSLAAGFGGATMRGDELWPDGVCATDRLSASQAFQKCVARYGGDRYAKNFSCWDQYLAMAFAQLTYRESLRDIEICLRSVGGKFVPHGFPHQRGALDAGRRQRIAGLEHLCRLRANIDCHPHAICMLASRWVSISIRACMLWIRRPSIYVCRCFRGRSFAGTSRRQDAHAAGPARGNIPRLSASPAEMCMT